MARFESLTKHLEKLGTDNFGEWCIDHKSKGTKEDPIQVGYVLYSDKVSNFVESVYDFEKNNEAMKLNYYHKILENNGIDWEHESIESIDVSDLDGTGVMAVIMYAIRVDRFCEGALLHFLKNGSMQKWLERLKEIDDYEMKSSF